jgi:choline kinase
MPVGMAAIRERRPGGVKTVRRGDGAPLAHLGEVIRRALILAAGRGSRMGGECPKPLVPVGGVPLVVRVLRVLSRAGVEEVAVVVGHRAREIERGIRAWTDGAGPRLRFLVNPSFDLPNGVSLRRASEFICRRTLVLMADHLFSASMLAPLVRLPEDGRSSVLAIDRALDTIFDLDDATKVRTRGGRLVDIGKRLPVFDAVDTGLFAVSPALAGALAGLRAPQLSDGVRLLARRGLMRTVDVTGGRWIDVDTPLARLQAERLLERCAGDLDAAAPLPADPAYPPAA